MSVLTDLSISYESLPGEPSYFVTAQQAASVEIEIPQAPLSIPFITQSPKPRIIASNFDISPSFTTRHAVNRQHHKKPVASHTSSVKTTSELKKSTDNKPAKTPNTGNQKISLQSSSRGLFNEFERASLLSYMQRRNVAV